MAMVNDPSTYQVCSVPRPRAEVEASLKAFNEELAELRLKHRIAEVVCLTEATVTGEQNVATIIRRGDARLHFHLLSSALAVFHKELRGES